MIMVIYNNTCNKQIINNKKEIKKKHDYKNY